MEYNFKSAGNADISGFLSDKLSRVINNTRFIDIGEIYPKTSSSGSFIPYAFPPSNMSYPYYSAYITTGNKGE